MPAITRTDVRGEMLLRAPILGKRLTADSLTKSGPSLTHVAEYERQRAGLTSYENLYIHRYNLADPERWRRITTLNSGATDGVINLDGPAFTNDTDKAYERLTVHPDDLNYAIAEAQRRQRVKTNRALTNYVSDLDMELTGVTHWAVAGTGTRVKDIANTFSGTQSLHYTAAAGVNQVASDQLRVLPNRNIYVGCIAQQVSGTFSFVLYDVANAVSLQTNTVTTQLGDWFYTFIQASTPSNATFVQLVFGCSSAGGEFYVDTCFGPYQSGRTEYDLPTQIDEAYKLRFVRPSKFLTPLNITQGTANGSNFGFFAADSLEFDGDLIRPEDWDIEAFRRDLHFNRLRFQANSYNNRNIGWGFPNGGTFMQSGMRPIWLALEAQVSAFEPLLTETSTTNQPLDEVACYALRYIAETMSERDPGNIVWANMLQEYKAWSVIEDMARPPQAMYTPMRYHGILA